MSDDDEKMETHPAYGLVRFSRFSIGGGVRWRRFFGSSIESMTGISLTICRARVQHRLGSDYYFGDDELIEVMMTESQFASLLTTMNVGSGIPCTIRHINGKKAPDLPDRQPEAMKIRESFKAKTAEWANRMKTMTDEIDTLLNKKGSLTVVEKKKIRDLTVTFADEMRMNATFLVDQFNESVDGVMANAKTEVEAFVNSAAQKTGLEILRGRGKTLLGMEEKGGQKD